MPRSRRVITTVALVAVLLVAGAIVGVRTYQPLTQVAETVTVGQGQSVTLEDFGEAGSHVLRYEDGASVTYGFTLRNAGPVGVTITSVALPDGEQRPLLRPLATRVAPGAGFTGALVDSAGLEPFALGPGQERDIVVQARFDNCEFYTERAISTVSGHDVHFRVAGIDRTVTVPLDRPLLVRSPTIRRCPERSMDRGERRRTDP